MSTRYKKNTQKEHEREKRLRKNKEELRELQNNIKLNNVHIIGIPEGGEEQQGIEKLFEKDSFHQFFTDGKLP